MIIQGPGGLPRRPWKPEHTGSPPTATDTLDSAYAGLPRVSTSTILAGQTLHIGGGQPLA
jgi:hypothetical protein